MLRAGFFTAVIALSVGVLIHAGSEVDAGRVPVLLELFTSEGCSSCPPADRLLQAFDQNKPIAGAELIVLSEHVDYWNHDGWKDPFSSAANTARQQEYTNKFHLNGVYTPQLVVDGRFGLVGSDARQASSAIEEALAGRKIPISISQITRDGDHITAHIELPSAGGRIKQSRGVLYIAMADNRTESQVSRGENSGRTLTHVAVVRALRNAGAIRLDSPYSGDVAVNLPAGGGSTGSRLVAFIQDPQSGHILGVATKKL